MDRQQALISRLLQEQVVADSSGSAGERTMVRFLQEGVILKGNPYDDKRSYPGSLLLVSETSTTYLLWLPYSYLFALAPHMLSQATRQKLCADGDAIPVPSESGNVPPEFLYVVCLEISQLRKLQRRTNLRGKKIIILTRGSGEVECPFIFNSGGMTKFIDELQRIANLKKSPQSNDEYFFPESSQSDVAEFQQPRMEELVVPAVQEHSDPGSTTRTMSSPASSDKDRFQEQLYRDAATPSKGSRMVSSMMTLGQRVHDHGKRLAGATKEVLRHSYSPVPVLDERATSADSGSFDMVAPIMEVEGIVPIVSKTSDRQMESPLTEAEWRHCFDDDGRLVDEFYARAKVKVYAGGIQDTPTNGGKTTLRSEVWSFLLGVYPSDSTTLQRAQLREERKKEYAIYQTQWETVTPEQARRWSSFREHRVAIEKDVSRTDRSHPAFAADDGPKLKQLHRVLMSYAMFNFDVGYCQGMSDILAMILLMVADDAEAFFLFSTLLERKCVKNFGADVLRGGMAVQMKAVDTLIKAFVPTLHHHLQRHCANDMSFVFRWLLILFKREFPINQVFVLWDVIFACPYTDQYELFVATAILRNVAPQILEQSLAYDEILKFTNAISGRMQVSDVVVLTAEFYDYVAEQVKWKRRTIVTAGDGEPKAVKPSLGEILELWKEKI